jgi:hypothetical protein
MFVFMKSPSTESTIQLLASIDWLKMTTVALAGQMNKTSSIASDASWTSRSKIVAFWRKIR